MQYELINPMVPLILLCNVWNMLKYALNYKRCPMVSLVRTQKNEMSYVSHFYFKLKLSKLLHLDVFYNIYFVFFLEPFFNLIYVLF